MYDRRARLVREGVAEGEGEARVAVHYHTVHSDKGHDSFLLEPELYTPFLTYALEVARVAKDQANP